MMKVACLIGSVSLPVFSHRRRRGAVLLGKEGAESVQASLGECSTILKPLLGDVETARRDGAGAHPPDLLGADQVTLLQNLQVLYHRRQGHRERRSQFTDRQ